MFEFAVKASVARRVAAIVAVIALTAGVGVGRAAVANTADTGLTVKVSGPAQVGLNEHYSYTVTVENRRSDGVAARDVSVVSTYYTSSLESWSGVAGAVCTSLGGGQLRCAVGDVPAGSERRFTVTLTPSHAGRESRTFDATAAPAMTGTGTYTTTINAPAPPPTPPAIVPSLLLLRTRTTVAFVVTVTNKGPGAMDNITVSDRYDYPVLEAMPTPDCTPDDYYIDCKIARLAQGASTTLRYVARIAAPDAPAPAQYLDVFQVSFPWHTNTSGFQDKTYVHLTKPSRR